MVSGFIKKATSLNPVVNDKPEFALRGFSEVTLEGLFAHNLR